MAQLDTDEVILQLTEMVKQLLEANKQLVALVVWLEKKLKKGAAE